MRQPIRVAYHVAVVVDVRTCMQAEARPAPPTSRTSQGRVSLPSAIAEGAEDVSAHGDTLLHPSTPRSGPAAGPPSAPRCSHAAAAALSGGRGAGGEGEAAAKRSDPQKLFWFGKPRLMLRIFR